MAFDRQEGHRPPALLAPEMGQCPPAAHTAQAMITAWHAIDDALTPVVGARGLVALYLRALHLAASDPALVSTEASSKRALSAATTPALLQALIARHSPADAVAIANTFRQVFHGLLSSLVGPSLTERLLSLAATSSHSSTSAQEKSP